MVTQICGNVPLSVKVGAPICTVGGIILLTAGGISLAHGYNGSSTTMVIIAGTICSLVSVYFCCKFAQIWKYCSPLSGGLVNQQIPRPNYQSTAPLTTESSTSRSSQGSTTTPEGHYKLGNHYLFGTGVKDVTKAAEHYKQAAAGGHPHAQYLLAKCYMNGAGVPQNHEEARKWIKKAAENGESLAQKTMTIYEARKKGSSLGTVNIIIDLYDDTKIELNINFS